MDNSRACTRCNVEYPLTREFWHRDNHSADGYRTTCKMCRSEEVENNRKEKVSKAVDKIEDEGVDLLDTLLKGGSDVPHMGETFQRIMEAFGGPGGLAQQIAATFFRSAPGSQQRQRILESILRLNIKVSEKIKNIKEKYNLLIIGIINEDGKSIINPDSNVILNPNDAILLIGQPSMLTEFKTTLI